MVFNRTRINKREGTLGSFYFLQVSRITIELFIYTLWFIVFRLDKWILDMTEGPCRMRKKMVKNHQFYIHYPYRPELESGDNVI